MADRPPWLASRATCLGCGGVVRRHRDSSVEMAGTKSGSWTMAIGTSAGMSMADSLPPPKGEVVFLLGVAHMDCGPQALRRIRRCEVQYDKDLPIVGIDLLSDDDPSLRVDLPATTGSCPFCNIDDGSMTEEDIFPLWLLRELYRRGARRLDGHPSRQLVGPTTPACARCNSTWMSVIENDVKDIVISLIDHARPLGQEEQLRLATWATMKALLFETLLPIRSVPRALAQDLRISRKPPPGVRVWMGAYCGERGRLQAIPWPVYAKDGETILALCITFTVVRIAFQVFIPFQPGGSLASLESFHNSVKMLYPDPTSDLVWPPEFYFDEESIEALACRIFNNREPVTREVTMRRSKIIRPNAS